VPPLIVQEKAVATGEIKSWSLAFAQVQSAIGWAGRQPAVLEREAAEMARDFPTWVVAAGQRLPMEESSVDSGELTVCAACGELCPFFDQSFAPLGERAPGPYCVKCLTPCTLAPAQTRLLAYAGQLPSPVSGRPYLTKMTARLKEWRRAGDERFQRFQKYFITVDGKSYFAPPLFCFYPPGWPHSEPYVMVRAEYFEVLDIPADHVYYAGPRFYRLCNYADWREVSLRTVLQQRVVPRILIDLIVADLLALGRLDRALDDLDTGLHGLYNVIGKRDAAETVLATLERHIQGP
jgi:hypothetical protein